MLERTLHVQKYLSYITIIGNIFFKDTHFADHTGQCFKRYITEFNQDQWVEKCKKNGTLRAILTHLLWLFLMGYNFKYFLVCFSFITNDCNRLLAVLYL